MSCDWSLRSCRFGSMPVTQHGSMSDCVPPEQNITQSSRTVSRSGFRVGYQSSSRFFKHGTLCSLHALAQRFRIHLTGKRIVSQSDPSRDLDAKGRLKVATQATIDGYWRSVCQ